MTDCKDEFGGGAEQRICMQGVNDERKGLSDFLREDKHLAMDYCTAVWKSCLDACGAPR
jgi:hypothetical protein